MPNQKLDAALRPIVDEYGLGSVLEALGKIASSQENGGKANPSRRKAKPKPTAPAYVAKMELPADKQQVVGELAERFERKDFLPSFGDIAHFCEAYGVELPSSRTRASAIPRIFKFIAELDTAEIQKISDSGMFTGPSQLAHIADAIRRNGRASRAKSPSML